MWNSPKNPDISYNQNLIYLWVWFLKIQLTNPTVWKSIQYLHQSFLPAPNPRIPLQYKSPTVSDTAQTQLNTAQANRGGKEFTDECSHYWPSSTAGTQAKCDKPHNNTPVWRWNCFFLHFFATGTPQAHTESCLSSWSLFLQNPPRLHSSCPRFPMFLHALCTYLQECIHRALLPVALNLNHSLMPQQTRWKHCHVIEAAPQTHLLQLQMRKAGRRKTLVNQPKAEYPLLSLSLKVCFFFRCIVAAIFLFCPNETNKTMLQALLIP